MNFLSYRHRTQMTLVALSVLAVSCVSFGSSATRLPRDVGRSGDDIVVASFDFPESALLAELYAGVLEEHGYPVRRLINLGSRETVDPALFQGLVDFVPEYLGTALAFSSLGRSAASSNKGAMAKELATLLQPNGVSVAEPAAAQNQNGFVVTKATAKRHGLVQISDLQDVAKSLAFGGPPECPERPLCLAGLEERYDLSFKEFLSLDAGGPATISALEGGDVDVALMFTTDPDIAARDLVLLEDDRSLQPAENIVPIVRLEVLDRYGAQFETTIRQVTRRLTTADLRNLNRRIELGERSTRGVAAGWLKEQGLTE